MSRRTKNAIQYDCYQNGKDRVMSPIKTAVTHHAQDLEPNLLAYRWFFYEESDSLTTGHALSNQTLRFSDLFNSQDISGKEHGSPDLSQGWVYLKLAKYLHDCGAAEGKIREIFINEGGDCNGWSFLHAYYSNTKSGQEFIDILSYISKWNGSIKSLNTNEGMSEKLKSKYHNGKELFEQTINDVTWFSHIKSSKICNNEYSQDDRLEQWEIVKDHKMELESIYTFLRLDKNILNKTNLPDILQIAAKWTDSFLDLGVYAPFGAHSLSLYITPAGKFKYYDCNHEAGPIETASAYEVCEYIFSSLSFYNNTCYLRDFSCYKFYPNTQPCPNSVQLQEGTKLPFSMDPKSVETTLTIAADSKQLDLFCSIYKMYDFNSNKISSNVKEKALSTGAQEGHLDVVSLLLLDNTVNLNCQQEKHHKTPLMLAAEHGHGEVVSVLLANGANSELKDAYGNTAYQLAIKNGHDNIVSLLEEAKQHDLMDVDDSMVLIHSSMSQINIHDCVSLKADTIKGLETLSVNSTSISTQEITQSQGLMIQPILISTELQHTNHLE